MNTKKNTKINMVDQEYILKTAIALFGITTQEVVAMEELSELIKELSKQIRGKGNRSNLIEELADVEIMIKQLRMIFSISDNDINKEIEYKLARLNNRICGFEDE